MILLRKNLGLQHIVATQACGAVTEDHIEQDLARLSIDVSDLL